MKAYVIVNAAGLCWYEASGTENGRWVPWIPVQNTSIGITPPPTLYYGLSDVQCMHEVLSSTLDADDLEYDNVPRDAHDPTARIRTLVLVD